MPTCLGGRRAEVDPRIDRKLDHNLMKTWCDAQPIRQRGRDAADRPVWVQPVGRVIDIVETADEVGEGCGVGRHGAERDD